MKSISNYISVKFGQHNKLVQVQFYLYSTFTTATRLTKVLYRARLKEERRKARITNETKK